MAPVDFYASESQYEDHLGAIWHALRPDERGVFYVRHAIANHAALAGIAPLSVGYPPPSHRLCVVASFQDDRASDRPTVYVEHGAGQNYNGSPESAGHPSYSGGGEHDRVRLFICPSETVAERWRARYPDVPAVAVGCPKLDAHHAKALVDGPRASRARDTRPVAAISFHAPIKLCPESDSAWPHYNAGLPAVVETLMAAGVHVLGHAHPRLWKRLGARWAQAGAEPVEDFAEILARADVYAADNTSTLPEAASCGIPLVWMNAPWYRRDVDHGARYWEWPRGQQTCDEPGELAAAILAALDDPPEVRAARERMVRGVYAFTDGHAAERAADAIRAANRV